MRIECKHYESRTYANGETVRKCDLDLAPEAPWRCPENCPKYQRRMDTAWSYGTAIAPPTPKEPASLAAGDGSISALLDEAESILNAAGPDIVADVEAHRGARPSRWRRLFRRR